MITGTTNKVSANDFTNVKDIKGIYLHSKDNYLFAYLKIGNINLELMSEDECRHMTDTLSKSFESDRKNWVYTSYPREIDLDKYKNELKQKYQQEISHIGRRHIIAEMMVQCTELATNGENFEHQHFIKLWKKIGRNRVDSEIELKNRVFEFKSRYENVGIHVDILTEQEIIKMCNLYGNSVLAAYDTPVNNLRYEEIGKVN